MKTWCQKTCLAAGVALVVTFAACGGGGPTGDVGSFKVEFSNLFLTVQNTAGLAMNDIRIEIHPSGRPNIYSTGILRLENSDKRDISLSSFKDREGAGFNLQQSKPKSVVITAKDLSGKTYTVEIPWK
jgi:hypothetical protein